jgi:hypothetical protein
MSPADNNLNDIPIYAQTEEAYSVGNIRALLSEIAAFLEKLEETGETGMIDLNSLPFAPGEYEQLRQTLGQGEVSARIEANRAKRDHRDTLSRRMVGDALQRGR